jgi:hypothetical protein
MPKETRLRKRYGWIEASLRYVGSFDKASYGKHFDINPPQISSDQAGFVDAINQISPGTLGVIRGKISILTPLQDEAFYPIPPLREWLQTSSSISYFEVNDFRHSDPDIEIVQGFTKSIQKSTPLRVLTDDEGDATWLELSPHCIVDIEGELFARAYDHRTSTFKTLPLSLFREVAVDNPRLSYVTACNDVDWFENISIDTACPVKEGRNRKLIAPRALSRHLVG